MRLALAQEAAILQLPPLKNLQLPHLINQNQIKTTAKLNQLSMQE